MNPLNLRRVFSGGRKINDRQKAALFAIIRDDGESSRHAELRQYIERNNLQGFINDSIIKDDEQTLLTYAAFKGREMMVRILVEEFGADPNQKDALGWTALMNASFRGHLPVVQWLVEHGNADHNIIDEEGHTAAMKARDIEIQAYFNALSAPSAEVVDAIESTIGEEPHERDFSSTMPPLPPVATPSSTTDGFFIPGQMDETPGGENLDGLRQELEKIQGQNQEYEATIQQQKTDIRILQERLQHASEGGGENDDEKVMSFDGFFNDNFRVSEGNDWHQYLMTMKEKAFDDLNLWMDLVVHPDKMTYICQREIGMKTPHAKMFTKKVRGLNVREWLRRVIPSGEHRERIAALLEDAALSDIESLADGELTDEFLQELGIDMPGHRFSILFYLNRNPMTESRENNPTLPSAVY